MLLTVDERGEVDEDNRDIPGQWRSGSLYEDSNDVLRLEFPDDSEDEAGNVLMFLLSATGGLQVRLTFHIFFRCWVEHSECVHELSWLTHR